MAGTKFQKKLDSILKLRRAGMTYSAIARRLGFNNKQAVKYYVRPVPGVCRCCHQPLKFIPARKGPGAD